MKNNQMINLKTIMNRYQYSEEIKAIIEEENLLPKGLLSRLHKNFPKLSGLNESAEFLFTGKNHYAGLKGFREINETLLKNGIDIGFIEERELFINVYRFLATKHVLNTINWNDFAKDSVFQLVFPQQGMISPKLLKTYQEATTEEDKKDVINNYIKETNPHDGKQKLNKPWFENEEGELEFLEGSQHKYPQCQLIFDKTTQNCFAFCTYCFRHAQVRGDEDMFIQNEVKPVIDYMKLHKEITDILITGGDGGYMPFERLEQYMLPTIEDPELLHIKTLRIGTRALTFHPELFLSRKYDKTLDLFKKLIDNGIQVVIMAHFSTPRELLNPSTIAAIRRLRATGIVIKSQSPVMNHISLFTDDNGKVDIDRSAQNWIDLGHILSMLTVNFHSMYCARPTGEHHYFTVPLFELNKIFSKIYRSLPSISRPSRYITMTSSAGKTSILGVTEVNGEKAFVLKFNESRDMKWMDKVFLAKYNEKENTIEKLIPFDSNKYFFEDDLIKIEKDLHDTLEVRLKK
jgi:L-lysine 2,3-aminomutase